MIDEPPTTPLAIRLATPDDIVHIELLDGFSTSPTRNIHRDMEKYFGSIDPSTHERTLIFLAELDSIAVAKAELMLPSAEAQLTIPTDNETGASSLGSTHTQAVNKGRQAVGYVKRVIVHPDFRKRGLARQLMQYVITFARTEQKLDAIDLHTWEHNTSAILLYEALGFELQHREIYFRLTL